MQQIFGVFMVDVRISSEIYNPKFQRWLLKICDKVDLKLRFDPILVIFLRKGGRNEGAFARMQRMEER
jgi:hypothetical protein